MSATMVAVRSTAGLPQVLPLLAPVTNSKPRLRITARGRAVLLFLAALPLLVALLVVALNGAPAVATDDAGSALQVVTVQPGQSLWALAESIAPGSDPRDVIQEIVTLNRLGSADLWAGQQLAIPARFTGAH